jgi:hypothetical protein
MQARPEFPQVRRSAGMYESFYLRAVSPLEPVGVWIRHTVHKPPGEQARGSIWCTVFDASPGGPFMTKLTSERLERPRDGWIEVGEQASFGPKGAEGSCGGASWSLRITPLEPPLRHLRPELLYAAPLPRTKLTSPTPLASFDGIVELPGRAPIELSGWHGMVGHNWGSEHAERWIWLHGCLFDEDPTAWLDVALGRILLAGRMTPWIANGTLGLAGERHRLGGLLGRRPSVSESPSEATLELSGEHGISLKVSATVPSGTAAGWRYADPDGGEHDVVNCSIASLHTEVVRGGTATSRVLSSRHGGVFELGMRERDHGVALAPFSDG